MEREGCLNVLQIRASATMRGLLDHRRAGLSELRPGFVSNAARFFSTVIKRDDRFLHFDRRQRNFNLTKTIPIKIGSNTRVTLKPTLAIHLY